ncbi:MAG: 2-succinyl-6-hydroxy-2,4-cyclohexadiene-carboxylate synthase [Actinomycetota bacterium]|jgi:2-succinyl-6-hydroxy-2,4-cyclohexadiene-1-carboxylate synthase|nr:2-succinyl-6-hydroxy-2,4-cyclohexadiene-carboxylate synthase [Actinomycetota bacterium]
MVSGTGLSGTVEGAGPRLTLVHGFTQTGRSWGEVARIFAAAFEVVRVDLPGHGRSADVGMSFDETASAIGDVGERSVYIGYSMGARLCLRLALERPELVRGLVLVGGSPGLSTSIERDARRQADEQLADDIEKIGTASFLRRWLSQRMFATLTPTEEDLESRRANPAAGLAGALRTLGVAAQEPLWGRLAELEMPVLLVAGELDAKFTVTGERMAAAVGPNAHAATLPGCGHAAHLEQPDAFCRLVWAALDPRTAHSATAKRASSDGSGTTRRTGSQPSTGSSGSDTTSAARRAALPRPQA